MTDGPERFLGDGHGLHELDHVSIDELSVGQTLVVKTAGSLFVLAANERSKSGTLYGAVTRYSEAPMTTEAGNTYIPDVIIAGQACFLFSGTVLQSGESMYFHGIHYAGRTYSDGGYDVIHTAPIDSISVGPELTEV